MTVFYGSNVADSTLTTACDLASASGGTETSLATTNNGTAGTFMEVTSKGLTNVPCRSSLPAPTGNGWVVKPGGGTFAAGNWSAAVTLSLSGVGDQLVIRFYTLVSGVYTSIGSITDTATINTAKTTYNFSATSMPSTSFSATDQLYVDLWFRDLSGVSTDTPTVYESTSSTAGVANDVQITTSTFQVGSSHLGFIPKYIPRGVSSVFHVPFTPVNIPRYVPRGILSTIAAYTNNITTRFLLALSRDVSSRFILAASATQRVKDVQARFRLLQQSLRDTSTRFRLFQVSIRDVPTRLRLFQQSLRDVPTRFRLLQVSTKDIALRFRLSQQSLRDITTRLRLQSANQLKDVVSRFRISQLKLKDLSSRFRLLQVFSKDVPLRLRLMQVSLKDIQGRLRLSQQSLKDVSSRFKLALANQSLRDLTTRFRIRSANVLKDVSTRFRMAIFRDVSSRFRISQSSIKDLAARLRLSQGRLGDIAGRFRLQVIGASSTPFAGATETFKAGLAGVESLAYRLLASEAYKSYLTGMRSFVQYLVLYGFTPGLLATHKVSMPTPLSSITSTVTLTDATGALVSNASAVAVIVNFPDQTSSSFSLSGATVTNAGSGKYTITYNTKGPGPIREVWNFTAADTVTIGSFQFVLETTY